MMRKKIADIEKSAIFSKSTSAKLNIYIKNSISIIKQVGLVDSAKERQVKGLWFKTHANQIFFSPKLINFQRSI